MATNKKKNTQNINSEIINRIVEELFQKFMQDECFLKYFKQQQEEPSILVLVNETEIKFSCIENIIVIKAEDSLCTFYLENNQKFENTCHLSDVEAQLPSWFFKINRGTIVNTRKMDTLLKKSRILKMLQHNKTYKFSKEKLYNFRCYLKQNASIITNRKP